MISFYMDQHVPRAIGKGLRLSCTQGILVYPVPLEKPLDAFFGSIRVRTISFSLSGDLEEAGEAFRAQLQDIVGSALAPTVA